MGEEEPIYVSQEEYNNEEEAIYELDARLGELEDRFDAYVRSHPDRLIVSPEEFEQEQYEIQALRHNLSDEWSRWGHYLATYRWLRRREARAIRRLIPPLSWSYLNLIRESRRNIGSIQQFIRDEIGRLERKLILPPDILRLVAEIRQVEDNLNRERARLQRKRIIQPVIAVLDSETGYQIVLYSQEITVNQETGRAWLYDEEGQEIIESVQSVRVEKTFSIDTSGHESLLAEITAYTVIDAEDLDDVSSITDQLEKKAKDWLLDKFTNVTRDGVPIVPNYNMTQDFTIQERNEDASYEGTIIKWMKTLEGWTEMPRILKIGVGYYQSDDKPTWNECYIYVEYAHGEEEKGHHRLPSDGWERFDP